MEFLAVALFQQGVALTGRNRTGPPCSVGRPTGHSPGGGRQPTRVTDDDDRRQRVKQYWLASIVLLAVVCRRRLSSSSVTRVGGRPPRASGL